MENLATILNGYQPVAIAVKLSIFDDSRSPGYVFGMTLSVINKNYNQIRWKMFFKRG